MYLLTYLLTYHSNMTVMLAHLVHGRTTRRQSRGWTVNTYSPPKPSLRRGLSTILDTVRCASIPMQKECPAGDLNPTQCVGPAAACRSHR